MNLLDADVKDTADEKTTEAKESLENTGSNVTEKGKGFIDTIRDWVAPAADKTHGKLTSCCQIIFLITVTSIKMSAKT